MGPGVGRQQLVLRLDESSHLAGHVEAAYKGRIGVVDVVAAVFDEVPELVHVGIDLAAGDGDRCAGPQFREAFIVELVQGFFQPDDAQVFQLVRKADRLLQVPFGDALLAGEEPGLVGVHAELDPSVCRSDHLFDHFQVFPGIVVMRAELHHRKAFGDKALHVLDALFRALKRTGAGIGEHSVLGAAQQLIDGQIAVFAQAVPDGDLHDPGAVGVLRGIDETCRDLLDLRNFFADHQGFDVAVPDAGQELGGVTRRGVTVEAVVGNDLHHGNKQLRLRVAWIPGGRIRNAERDLGKV